MSLIKIPNTSKGVLIALGLLGLIVVWMYAGTLLTVGVGAIIITLGLYALYIVGYRLNRLVRDKRILGGRS
ncbi:hypothetical protein [Halomontanus rarus]|uniref:hypothetical protein n=1 Tax=Halomontanus rarus TaxID=3034020 RepID=UPI00307BD52B